MICIVLVTGPAVHEEPWMRTDQRGWSREAFVVKIHATRTRVVGLASCLGSHMAST